MTIRRRIFPGAMPLTKIRGTIGGIAAAVLVGLPLELLACKRANRRNRNRENGRSSPTDSGPILFYRHGLGAYVGT